MKKLLASLVVIGLVAGTVILSTSAFFSDTETSTGNSFTAGALDLKVDSWAHYNGFQCVGGWWQTCTDGQTNKIVNGDFEEPEVTSSDKWDIFETGTAGLGWTVEWAGSQNTFGGQDRPAAALQELHEGVNGWAPYTGNQHAELDSDWDGPGGPLNNEPALVKIYQNVPTVAGTLYKLTYAYAARPGTSSADNGLEVRVDNTLINTHNSAGVGSTVNWQLFTHTFVATDQSTKVEFKGIGDNNSLGVFLDAVSLVEMSCTRSEEYTQACTTSWSLTDLGPSHKFFNFADIKPGDYGENTISLHVDNNDAYACVVFGNLESADVTLVEPEQTLGDTGVDGELDDNIKFFAWRDDGNNIWEDGETPMFGASPVLASDINNVEYALAVPGNPFIGGDTNYIGIAWCAGDMSVDAGAHTIGCNGASMGNASQTDSMGFDVSFYIEQARHNEAFACTGHTIPEVVVKSE